MTPTLPGSIPGLLQRGSPVCWRDAASYVVICVDGKTVLAAPACSDPVCVEDDASSFALDLSDPTGQVHAAWWAMATTFWTAEVLQGLQQTIPETETVVAMATMRMQMSAKDVDALRRAVLYLAGVTP